ncbi:hypothetical protein JW921_03950, partial [Candidatus Fermentibacterales bacterium]|nr:hypothetical protein [Candidatus Fermentibacterales bacterium]
APRASATESAIQTALEIQAPAGADSVGMRKFELMQIGSMFLVSSTQDALVVLDQHAAHERVLFERFLLLLREGDRFHGHQTLLLPDVLRLDPDELESLDANSDFLRRAGFDFEVSGEDPGTVSICSVPAGCRNASGAFRSFFRELRDPETASLPESEMVAAALACAGAIKAGERLTPDEGRLLVDQLFATSDPFHCPHGRPTLVEIPFSELERRLGR